MMARLLLMMGAEVLAAPLSTGVHGVVYTTPAHPGPQRIGESARAPMAGVTVQVRDKQHTVTSVITNAEGAFSAALPPGEYSFSVDVGTAALPRCGAADVIVRDKHVENIELECDSGMR
jgi:hypothetical protein